ncbi:aromatic amino acid:proton symporter (AAT family) [Flavobacterium sp. 90]|uniref:amino acid permease n=1 Tax=unclassified Flavobacterium TaxID=196869 RepID=UPI000EB523E9|nr:MULTISPECIES: amino acid permease [unclassified Flavobacterium]RKR05649.1 aromatic amino acid:proton symporter (AAT family) [Flavobacterium sp. 81]TCK56962.1 aromatic amino acid:proton symporter (AAT family) [Flavobacterium sp. 90]
MKNTQENVQDNQLKRGLTNRHIQLIALGGSIGTGLFLGIGPAAVLAGPSVILGYAIAGIIAFFIMRQLGEMVVEEPVSGSFSHFAYKYCGSFAGFASGWNYWILYILVSMAELTAIGVYVQFWWPEIPLWASSLFFFLVINALNFASVKVYGETEFWFSIIKVVAIIAMILFGTYLLISGTGGEHATIHNLYNDGGFFPKGFFEKTAKGDFQGLLSAMALIMFSFGGLELIGITAAEAENPEKNIPKATNQVIYRILIFYVGALVILFALSPWRQITTDSSPFVMVFQNLNGMEFELFGTKIFFTKLIANVLNLIVLTAALSVYNSSVYSNSRMLYGLADQGSAPKFLKKLNRHAVPINAILISSCFAAICILINKVMPEEAFSILMSLVVSCLVINWVMISYTHLRFRLSKDKENTKTKFPSLFYPVSNYICFVFLFGILSIMWITNMKLSVELIPIWLGILFICFKVLKAKE